MSNHKSHAIQATNMLLENPNTFKTLVSKAKCLICNPVKLPEELKNNANINKLNAAVKVRISLDRRQAKKIITEKDKEKVISLCKDLKRLTEGMSFNEYTEYIKRIKL